MRLQSARGVGEPTTQEEHCETNPGNDDVGTMTSSRKDIEEKGKSKTSADTSQLSLSNELDENESDDDDRYDDTCMVCGDYGDLVCCDGCPATYHQSCLDMETLPSGDWYCAYCRCKFCGTHSKPFDHSSDDSLEAVLLTCRSCWQKYHNSCIDGGSENSIHPRNEFACGSKCQELTNRLQMLIGVKHEIEDGFYWSLVRWTDINAQIKPINQDECNSKVVGALAIMKRCFARIIDDKTKIEIVSNVVKNEWSHFPRLNFEGFVTAVLEKGGVITSVASIRIHGNEMAEIPFIGTHLNYRQQGMCRRLMNGIESALGYLNVELLILPSVSEATETWTSCFGFEPADPYAQKLMKEKHIMLFADTEKLQKKMPKLNASHENLSFIEVFNLHKNQNVHRKANNYDEEDESGSDNEPENRAINEDIQIHMPSVSTGPPQVDSSSQHKRRGHAAEEVSSKRARHHSF